MDVANRRSLARARARARTSAKWVESTATARDVTGNDAGNVTGNDAGNVTGDVAGAVARGIETGYWWNQIPVGCREKNVNIIMSTLKRHLPSSSQERLQKLAVHYEGKIYKIATSGEDYSWKMSKMMPAMEAEIRRINYLHPNAASNGQNAHGPEVTMEATSYKTTSGPEESDEEQAAEEDDGDVSKEDVVEEVVVTKEQNYVVGREENVRVIENKISCGLSSGAKLDERLTQVEERLEKIEAHSEKVETLLVGINKKLNCLVKMQDPKVSRDIRRPAKYMSSSWTSNGRSKRKRRVAEMIRPSCNNNNNIPSIVPQVGSGEGKVYADLTTNS